MKPLTRDEIFYHCQPPHIREYVLALIDERDELLAVDECQVDGRPSCQTKTESDWCRACLYARFRAMRDERDALEAALTSLRAVVDAALRGDK